MREKGEAAAADYSVCCHPNLLLLNCWLVVRRPSCLRESLPVVPSPLRWLDCAGGNFTQGGGEEKGKN